MMIGINSIMNRVSCRYLIYSMVRKTSICGPSTFWSFITKWNTVINYWKTHGIVKKSGMKLQWLISTYGQTPNVVNDQIQALKLEINKTFNSDLGEFSKLEAV